MIVVFGRFWAAVADDVLSRRRSMSPLKANNTIQTERGGASDCSGGIQLMLIEGTGRVFVRFARPMGGCVWQRHVGVPSVFSSEQTGYPEGEGCGSY